MPNKICSWIAAIVAFIILAPLPACAFSVHSDFGVPLAEKYLKENNHHTGHD
jgi:hypothetical protein